MNSESIRLLRREGKHAQARDLAVELARRMPGDAEVQYEAACVLDFLGQESDAVACYRAAMAGKLAPERLRSAYLGLGSSYRALGSYEQSETTLAEGLAHFPEANEIKVFIAMAQYNRGKTKQAVETLLSLLVQTSGDEAIQKYREAIAFYAKDMDKSWP